MPDILIRDVPVEDIARIDANAARQGLSRSEYLRRRLRQEPRPGERRLTHEDLAAFTNRIKDVDDPEVMRQAWS